MLSRTSKYILVMVVMHGTIYWRTALYAQAPLPASGGTGLANTINLNTFYTAALDVYLKGPDGKPLQVAAVVTLLKLSNEPYRQETARAGHIRFDNLAPTEYSLYVTASGYQTAVRKVEADRDAVKTVTIELQQLSAEDAAENSAYKALTPKAQKEIGKALELLRANKPADARNHLDAANRVAPNQAEVQYLYGVHAKQTGNEQQAKLYWMKAVESSPKHLPALLSLADALLRENQLAEALVYVTRAVEAEPSSWRAHAILANVYLRLDSADEAVKNAERAQELGHEQAAIVEPVLAAALARRGEKARAITVLQAYLQEHGSDMEAKKLLERLRPQTASAGDVPKEAETRERTITALQAYLREHESDAEAKKLLEKLQVQMASAGNAATEEGTGAVEDLSLSTSTAASLPLPSSWLPPDVDEKVPPVESGPACVLEDVVRRAGKRMQEFVSNVDRFTATEDLIHKSINKFGSSSVPETRTFEYVVSIEESRPGFLNVEEYRSSRTGQDEFPNGVATHGLPALALIFHPFNAKNFEMSCEGLGRWRGGLAWQVHFRQRTDRPNVMRAYKLGENGPSYPVGLRGRAWIAADSYQIVRLETDLIAPVREIRLFADHTAIEYGPVRFKNRNVQMWLPQTAEVYFDWRGRRMHRRHSFSNYLLFSVDEKQHISAPKVETQNQPEN